MPSAEEITRHHDADPAEDPWVHGPPAPELVEVVAYTPEWPIRYRTLAAGVAAALGDTVLDIEHVGSTAVEGLAAKDVIDIDLTVADPTDEDAYVPALENLGYVLTVRERSFHQHRCLRLASPRANLHVFGPDYPEHPASHVSRLATHSPRRRRSPSTRNEPRYPEAGT